MYHIRRYARACLFTRAFTVLLFLACALNNTSVATATAAEPFFNKAADTFVADDFCLEVWRAKRMPLRVFIHDCSSVAAYDPRFKQSFIDACSELTSVTDHAVAFSFTESEADAEIDVRWVASRSQFPTSKWPEAIGICNRSVDEEYGTVEHASIYFLTKPESGAGTAYGPKFMLQTCLHELGHACGLGHSLRVDDVMYKRHGRADLSPDGMLEMQSTPHFSARDAASLKLLIAAQNRIINIKESCEAKNACAQFNNEAFRLIKAGDNGQALIYLRAALERDENNKLAMGNAMIALFNCACDLNNRLHWAEALPILEKAIKLAKKVGSPGEMNQMVAVQKNCMTQLARRKNTGS